MSLPHQVFTTPQDCEELPHPHDTPSTPSAFSLWNTLSGPFSDAAVAPVRARAPRDWENEETFGDGWGASAPINIGKRARNRDRERMERRALELLEQEQDDPGDWFANARNMRNRGVRGGGEGGPDAGGHGRGVGKKDAKIRIGRAWKSDDPPPSGKPSLLERVSNDDYDQRSRGHHHYGRDRDRDRDRDRGRERDHDHRDRGGWERNRDRERDRDRDRGRDRGRDDDGEGFGLRIRGSASRFDHTDSEVGERKGRRREESRNRSRDRERESRTSRDQGPRGPQYKGGYMR
jgi:protein AIR1/2